METPEGVPEQFEDQMQLMYDMVALAFETDMTRIATLILAHDGSNRSFPMIDINRGHHDLSHHQGNKENLTQIAKIDRHYMTYFAKFLEKLSAMKDPDGTSVLHNSMIVYAGGNADGNAHSHDDLPVILAGAGGGALRPDGSTSCARCRCRTCSSTCSSTWASKASIASAIPTVAAQRSDSWIPEHLSPAPHAHSEVPGDRSAGCWFSSTHS